MVQFLTGSSLIAITDIGCDGPCYACIHGKHHHVACLFVDFETSPTIQSPGICHGFNNTKTNQAMNDSLCLDSLSLIVNGGRHALCIYVHNSRHDFTPPSTIPVAASTGLLHKVMRNTAATIGCAPHWCHWRHWCSSDHCSLSTATSHCCTIVACWCCSCTLMLVDFERGNNAHEYTQL